MSTEITTTLTAEQLPEIYRTGTIKDVIGKIKAEAMSVVTDPSTEKGRKEIASLAYKISRTKTAIDEAGKSMGDSMRKQLESINADRKLARDELDALKDEVRKPLTEFEERQKQRILTHQRIIEEIKNVSAIDYTAATDVRTALTSVDSMMNREWEEFRQQAESVYATSTTILRSKIERIEKQEAERIELERLRKDQIEREQKEREERIARDAAERAKAEAERAAKEERERAEREQKRREDAIAAEAKKAKESAERAEREKLEAEARHKRELEAAQAKARLDVELKEKERLEVERKAQEAEQKRVENQKHRSKVKNQAYLAMVPIVGAEHAKALVVAIDDGTIANIYIRY